MSTLAPLPFARIIADESARAADALEKAEPGARVPACADWSALDLAYHLGEVQDSWARTVHASPADPDEEQTQRRPDDELVPFLRDRTQALLDELAGHEPSDRCWSWSPAGGDIAWVLRRQAHEALVHRVDAEQVAGLPVTDPGSLVAVDGVDEVLRVMVGALPAWAVFRPDGGRVRIAATDAGRSWVLALGRFRGTSPVTGNSYDECCAVLVRPAPWEGVEEDVSATVEGAAWDLDLWLWGRGPVDALRVSGDDSVVERLREVVVEATQ